MNYFDFMFESECGVQKGLAELNRNRSKKFFRMFCGNIDIALNKAIKQDKSLRLQNIIHNATTDKMKVNI